MNDLDRQVAEALGYKTKIDRHDGGCRANIKGGDIYPKFSPSTNWAQGGPLIEEYAINFQWPLHSRDFVDAWPSGKYTAKSKGETPLIAAMKALVASKESE